MCGCSCAYVCVFVVAVLPVQGGTGPRHLESFSENFKCGRRGMCAQIKERKVKEKYSKERGWRVREIDTHRYRQREARDGECGRWGRGGGKIRREEGVPPERETFGVEEDTLNLETGVRMRARRGKQNGEKGGRQQKTEIWSKWQTVGAAEEKKQKKKTQGKKVEAAHSLPTVLH